MSEPQTLPADEIRCTDEEGRRYREGVYRPLDDVALPEAPRTADFPDPGWGPPFRLHTEVPRVPRVRHLVGPSVIALGMGLGAGEFILWPNLIVSTGFSIWWLFWIGVLTQFVVIIEIERWTIATGESVFGGMARLDRFGFWPWFFLLATLVSFFWPGWASQSADYTGQVIASLTGEQIAWQPLSLIMFAVIWVGLAVSRIVYNALERFEIALVLGFFPLLFVALLVAGVLPGDVMALLRGAVSVGSAPSELLTGDQFPVLLIAVAYAGSGGTLLLAQSLWIRDKGFGMANYQGRIAGIRGANEEVSATGYAFDHRVPTALARFRGWMRVARSELFWTFFVLIVLSVVITTLLAAATVGTDRPDLAGRMGEMVRLQGDALAAAAGEWMRILFLLGGAFVLFSTQVGIVDTVTRITGSIFYERFGRHTRFFTLKRSFLIFLTIFVLAGMAIVLASWRGGEAVDRLQPDFLILIAGPFTITSMYLFSLVVGYMSVRRLPPPLTPPLWGRVGLLWAGVLWGWFTAEEVSRMLLRRFAEDAAVIESIAWHPLRALLYGLWMLSLVWFAWKLFAADWAPGGTRGEGRSTDETSPVSRPSSDGPRP